MSPDKRATQKIWTVLPVPWSYSSWMRSWWNSAFTCPIKMSTSNWLTLLPPPATGVCLQCEDLSQLPPSTRRIRSNFRCAKHFPGVVPCVWLTCAYVHPIAFFCNCSPIASHLLLLPRTAKLKIQILGWLQFNINPRFQFRQTCYLAQSPLDEQHFQQPTKFTSVWTFRE